MEIKQLGGKFIVKDGKPVGVWLMLETGQIVLYSLTEMQYAELEKLSESNIAI